MTAALSPPQSLLERLPHEWEELFAGWGQPRYRARQVFAWIHQRGILEPQAMTDLPGPLRLRLAQEGLAPPLTVVADQVSSDGTRKLLVEMVDSQRVETVLIPRGSVAERDVYAPPQDDDGDSDDEPDPAATEAYSQCISSQVGCAMGCAFCASGIAGLKRQMTAGEIYAQVLLGRARLEGQRRQSGIVFMGMGEPLHNYPAVARVLELLRTAEGFGMSLRRVTVSTSGLIPELRQLAEDFGGRVRLAVSVHASDSASRSRIMPINRRYPLPDLLAALREYPVPGLGRITIEYTLLGGDNDSDGDALRLSEQLAGLPVKVNLIPVNPVPEAAFPAPSEARVASFQRILRARGLDTFVRRRKGDDIAAACGQLALHGEKRKVRVL